MTVPMPNSDRALRFITNIKLAEVDNQRHKYQEMAQALFDSKEMTANDDDSDKETILRRVELLIAAVTEWKGPGQLEGTTIGDGKLDLENLRPWMDQARKEAGFDLKVIKGWAETLAAHVHHTCARFDAAKLVWQMYQEWIESDDIKVVSLPLKEAGEIQAEVDAVEEEFDMVLDAPRVGISDRYLQGKRVGQDISGAETKEAKEKERILSIILEEYPTDTDRLTAYLDDLFGSEDAQAALSRVRASLYAFGSSFSRPTIDRHDISQAISALLAMGIMDEYQRTTLKEIQSSETALQEVATVIQLRLVDLKSWRWQKQDVDDAAKDTNGNLSAFADAHVIDSMLWEYIGNRWRQEIKSSLWTIFESHAWKRDKASAEQCNAMYAIEPFSHNDSITTKREKLRSRYFFLPNLNNPAPSLAINYDFAEMNQREKDIRSRSLTMFKRVLLHLMATESRLNDVLHGSHTMTQIKIEDLEHSLSHQSILIVLAYIGVPEGWILAFHSFLAKPVSTVESRVSGTCKRGTPVGYTLSVVLREVVLHVMHFAVNQRSEGLFLYRIGNDISFWDASAAICFMAQREIEEYASLVGIRLDVKRVSTSRRAASKAVPLPMEDIKWGFLKFDPARLEFVIDQGEVDLQVIEFRNRLASTKSIIGWVEVYNKYMGHFWRNFGGIPAECLGDEFVDDMIDTFTRIHRALLVEPDIGPAGYLRQIIGERFGVEELPDGYFYLPFSSGGLDLYNVILCLTSLERERGLSPGANTFPRHAGRSSVPSLPSNAQYSPAASRFKNQFFDDLQDYTILVARWKVEEGGRLRKSMTVEQDFISFGEYASLRECHLASWGRLYDSMFQNLRVKTVSTSWRAGHPNPTRSSFAAARWRGTESYARWVVSIYGEEVIKRFGTVNMVDKLLIPVAMTDGLRD